VDKSSRTGKSPLQHNPHVSDAPGARQLSVLPKDLVRIPRGSTVDARTKDSETEGAAPRPRRGQKAAGEGGGLELGSRSAPGADRRGRAHVGPGLTHRTGANKAQAQAHAETHAETHAGRHQHVCRHVRKHAGCRHSVELLWHLPELNGSASSFPILTLLVEEENPTSSLLTSFSTSEDPTSATTTKAVFSQTVSLHLEPPRSCNLLTLAVSDRQLDPGLAGSQPDCRHHPLRQSSEYPTFDFLGPTSCSHTAEPRPRRLHQASLGASPDRRHHPPLHQRKSSPPHDNLPTHLPLTHSLSS